MKPILLVYATREGHTQQIAEYVADMIRKRGAEVELVNAAHVAKSPPVRECAGAIVAASVHQGRHQKELIGFVKDHVADLSAIPTVFLSVSLSEAGAEDVMAPPAKRAQAAADVQRIIGEFLKETGWRPATIRAVAGALLYTKYNFLLRLVMKRIANQAGGRTDTSKDYDYTDWAALERLAEEFVEHLGVAPKLAAQ